MAKPPRSAPRSAGTVGAGIKSERHRGVRSQKRCSPVHSPRRAQLALGSPAPVDSKPRLRWRSGGSSPGAGDPRKTKIKTECGGGVATRADKGQVRLTPRDRRGHDIHGRAVRHPQGPARPLARDVSDRTLRALIDRWVRAGLINRRTIFAGEPRMAVADPSRSRAGADRAPLLGTAPWHPRARLLGHRGPLPRRGAPPGFHLDLGAPASGRGRRRQPSRAHARRLWCSRPASGSRSRSSSRRSREPGRCDAVAYLTDTHDGVWIFAQAGGPTAALERAVGQLPPDRAKKVRLLPLEKDS